jgi:hypothetical protein
VWTSAMAIQASGGNPYQPIVDRNVFGLKPPAPPPDPEANKPPPPKIVLTGIYKMGGNPPRALMKISMPPRPPDPAKDIPLILSEGQRDSEVEVLSIDTVASIVKVNNSGTVMTLDFTNNGAAKMASAAPAAGSRPGSPGGPAPGPSPFPMPAPAGAAPNPAARQMRFGAGAAVSPSAYNPTAAASIPVQSSSSYSATPAYNTSPGVGVGGTAAGTLAMPGMATTTSTGQGFKNWPPEPNLTPEQTAIMQEAYMQKYAQEIQAGKMPSIPGFKSAGQEENTPGQTTTPPNTQINPPLPPGAARRYGLQ